MAVKEEILILLREFQDSNVELGKLKVNYNYGIDFVTKNDLDNKIIYLRNKIINNLDSILKDTENVDFKPKVIQNHTLISQNIFNFVFKWNAYLAVISDDNFNFLNRLINVPTSILGKNEKRLMVFQERLYGIDRKDKSIYFSEKFKPGKTCTDALVLHELCHVLLKMEPRIINEAASPLYSLWYHFMKYCEVDHQMFNPDEHLTKNIQLLSPRKYPTIKEYVESFIPELVELGLLKEDGSPTFVRSHFYPKQNWLLENFSTF